MTDSGFDRVLTFNEFAALSALSDKMTTPIISAALEARLRVLGLVGRVAGELRLTSAGIARVNAGK